MPLLKILFFKGCQAGEVWAVAVQAGKGRIAWLIEQAWKILLRSLSGISIPAGTIDLIQRSLILPGVTQSLRIIFILAIPAMLPDRLFSTL